MRPAVSTCDGRKISLLLAASKKRKRIGSLQGNEVPLAAAEMPRSFQQEDPSVELAQLYSEQAFPRAPHGPQLAISRLFDHLVGEGKLRARISWTAVMKY